MNNNEIIINRFKKYIAFVTPVILLVVLYFFYEAFLWRPCHPIWFFTKQKKEELTILSEKLFLNISENWLWIDTSGIKGPEWDLSYLQKYKSIEVFNSARDNIKKYGFRRIHFCSNDKTKYVAFAYYRKSSRVNYYYVYYPLNVPLVSSDQNKFTKKIDKNWRFESVLPSCQ